MEYNQLNFQYSKSKLPSLSSKRHCHWHRSIAKVTLTFPNTCIHLHYLKKASDQLAMIHGLGFL